MIIKSFELKKKKLKDNKYFLLNGSNEGLIEETIEEILKPILAKNIYNYEESDILKNIEDFKENLLNKSFFENEKLIIIKRISDKFFKIIEELVSKNIEDLSIILVASNLDKRSKIRVFFEKEKNTTCVPFYEDNAQALSFLAKKFLKDKNINISQQLINIIIERAKGDRINLKNELQKIESFSENKKNIQSKNVVCLSGEGGLEMNIQELATILHHQIPIKIFIYNNGGYLTIKQTQQLGFKSRIMGSDYDSGLSFPNYKLISKSHNIRYFKISETKKIKHTISKILKINKPVICELILDNEQEQMPKAINRRTPNGKSIPTTFEDMYPFLPRNELKSNML